MSDAVSNISMDSEDREFLTRVRKLCRPKKKKKRRIIDDDDDDLLDTDVNALAAKEKKAEVEKKHEEDAKSGKLDKFKNFQADKEKRLANKMAMRLNLNFSDRKKLSQQEKF